MKKNVLSLIERMGLLPKQIDMIVENIKNGILLEMALPRKEYINRVDAELPQLIENWCLVHYAKLSGDKQELINHWRNELRTHIFNIVKLKLKDDKQLVYEKALYEIWNKMEYYDPEIINMTIISKFIKENINVRNNKDYLNTIYDFITQSKRLIYIMSNKNVNDINDYIVSF